VIGTSRWLDADARLEGRAFLYRWGWPGAALAAAGVRVSQEGAPFTVLHPSVATAEGWASYAASLAGELGLYPHPMDAYGRLLREGFEAALLVVDTGVHYFGWTKPQALALLRRYSLLPDDQLDGVLVERVIATPGQAGAAPLGARELAAMRAWMQGALGSDFDARAWHRELLVQGPATLPVLARHVEWWEWSQRAARPR
jgi:uncharacterized protein (DUF885 family)